MIAHLPADAEAEPSTMEVMNRQEETGQPRDKLKSVTEASFSVSLAN